MTIIKTKKNDFIELEFNAKANNELFDTTSFEEAKQAGLANENLKERFKPMKLCIGQEMVLKAFDKELEDKEPEKEYEIEIKAKEAYGTRDSKLLRTISLSAFEQMPQKGMFVNINNMVAKVISITGGRVLVDMNHPLAGKDLFYKFKILKIIEKKEEKVQTILELFNISKESFILENENNKIIIRQKVPELVQKQIKDKLKKILSVEVEFREDKNNKLEDTLEKKN